MHIFSTIANKYYFETQNNIFGVIGCKISNEISLIWNFEDYTMYSNRRKNKINIYKQDIENFIFDAHNNIKNDK